MQEQALDKKLADQLMKIKGEARGITLKVDWDYIFHQKGREGVEKLEAKMAELGYPLKYEEIRVMDFYPIGLDTTSILAIKEVFGYGDKDIERMGGEEINFSIFLKVFMKYFRALPLVAREGPKMWREHYSVGELKIVEINEGEKRISIRIENFNIHPILCLILKGYLSKVMQLVVKASVRCQEVKCSFRGGPYHEFLFEW